MRPALLALVLALVGCSSTSSTHSTSTSTSASGGASSSSGGSTSSSSSSSTSSTSSSTGTSGTTSGSSSTSSSTTTSSGSGTTGASSTSGSSTTTSTGTSTSGTTGAVCATVSPHPDVDPWTVRAPSAGFGAISTQTSNGHTDVFLDSPASGGTAQGYIRVGARLDWGGTIVFFGLGANPNSNAIDANDTGRELQLALYDPDRAMQGCAYNASCATTPSTCGNSITYLGWDPVQGGDECGHGGTVLSYQQQGDALQLQVQPLQWNPNWDQASCVNSACGASGVPVDVTYTFSLRYVHPNVVEIATEVSSNESFDHRSTSQEFPTLYVAHGQNGPDLSQLFDAAGNLISITTPANNGFYVNSFTSPEPWVSWQDTASDYGVAIAMDQGVTAFQGWRGDGSTAPYFHNVRAQMSFGLAAGGTVRGLSYLALGSYSTVTALVHQILAERPPFGVVDVPTYPGGAQGGTSVHVAGWVLDTAHLANVDVSVDGARVGSLPVNGSRPDVCAEYPDYDGCPNVGFDGTVSVPALADGCHHLLQVSATDADGNTTVLAERAISAQ